MEDDDERQERLRALVDIPPQQRGEEHGVPQTADRKEFADALQHRQQHCLHERHVRVGSHAGEAFPLAVKREV